MVFIFNINNKYRFNKIRTIRQFIQWNFMHTVDDKINGKYKNGLMSFICQTLASNVVCVHDCTLLFRRVFFGY